MSAMKTAVSGKFPFSSLVSLPSAPLVIATLGPATDSVIKGVAVHADIARIHSAHNSIADYEQRAASFLSAPNPAKRQRKIFADLVGFGVRTSSNTIDTKVMPGSLVNFIYKAVAQNNELAICIEDEISQFVKVGHPVSMGDGAVWMNVQNVSSDGTITCRVMRTPGDGDYIIEKNKGLNFPLTEFPDTLVERDKMRMRQLASSKIVPDYIGLSFTQSPKLVIEAREFAKKLGLNDVNFVVKIENQVGARNVREIIKSLDKSDVTMAAFGDMVPELMHKPRITDVLVDIHTYSLLYGKEWVACTGLGKSMVENPEPTTAETLTHGIIARMGGWLSLSGDELAMNFQYPVEAIKALRDAIDHNATRAALSLNGMPRGKEAEIYL